MRAMLFLRWIRGIRAIRRRACVLHRRGISESWACDAEKHCVGWLAVWGRHLLRSIIIVLLRGTKLTVYEEQI